MKERIERLKKLTYIPQQEIVWLIEQAELSVKQQEIIEEHKRQQDIAVNQFRQAQEEIQRLKKENTRYEYLLGESELSDKIQSICDHCKLTSGGREITIKDEEFGFLIEEANKSHRLQEENEELKLKVEEQDEEIRDWEFENMYLESEVEELQERIEALEGNAE
ncbi:hypothetical protein P9654_09955 [Bacillus atrophaeus]|uniref:hypothetical protein n=1 Tax=Bacillus atrophaeus TaxID=1452 RepID=UPI001CC22AE4|nr:hypothetical protein [Bacillus atrophaeus]